MKSSRISRRPGFNVQRGSTNPKITVNATAPLNPKHKDVWIDISGSPLTVKWWDAEAIPAAWTT